MTKPFLLGLTGSIGMGKSTTAAMLRAEGLPVWDADATVHALYAVGGAGVPAIAALRPEAVVNGSVSRDRLKEWIAADPSALKRVEGAIHPLVAAHRAGFIQGAAAMGAAIVVLDIPLLFETGAESSVDAVLVVSAPADIQHQRVMDRPGMTEAHLAQILSRQLPDAEKRARADHVIETLTEEGARAQVRALVARMRAEHA